MLKELKSLAWKISWVCLEIKRVKEYSINRQMKKLISVLFIFTFLFSYSQIKTKGFVSNSINSFKSGEWLRFRVHYGFFNASEIEIELEKKN